MSVSGELVVSGCDGHVDVGDKSWRGAKGEGLLSFLIAPPPSKKNRKNVCSCKYHVKFGHVFFGQKCLPKVDWAPTPMDGHCSWRGVERWPLLGVQAYWHHGVRNLVGFCWSDIRTVALRPWRPSTAPPLRNKSGMSRRSCLPRQPAWQMLPLKLTAFPRFVESLESPPLFSRDENAVKWFSTWKILEIKSHLNFM